MSRSIVIGDVHGCLQELDELLARLSLSDGDQLCFIGDLVDRGPDSVGVIRRVRELFARYPASICLCGNHEEKALRFHERGRKAELEEWARLASEEDFAFLEALPLLARLDAFGVLLIHGGSSPACSSSTDRSARSRLSGGGAAANAWTGCGDSCACAASTAMATW